MIGCDFWEYDADIPGHEEPEEPEDIYNENELKARLEEIRASGVSEYALMDIEDKHMRKAKLKRAMLFGFNIPMMVGLPLWSEFGNFADVLGEKADKVLNLLILTDLCMVINSVMIYTVVSKVITEMKYLPEENKVKVKGFSSNMLIESEQLYDPKEIEKFKLSSLNPTIGYKTVAKFEGSR